MTDLFTNAAGWADMAAWEAAALRLHAAGPMHRVEAPGYAPFWAVIDHATLMDVERNTRVFRNAPRPVIGTIEEEAKRQRDLKALIHMDGDEHAAYRRLGTDFFKPGSLGRLDAKLEHLSKRSMEKMADLGGECDFVREIALPYPLEVILEMLGLPEADYQRMLRLTQELFGQEDPDLRRAPASPEVREAVIADFFAYFEALTNDRRAKPTNDLASAIANGEVNGCPLPHTEMMGYYIIVSTAGHDTTSYAMAGGMELLARHPEALAELRADPALLVNAIEEIIRRATPVRHFMRTVSEDIVLAGQQLRAGDRIYLSYKAANLDPKVFPDPQRFDIRRANANKHVAFGYGPHFCLGAQLARNELRSLFGRLIPRLARVELAGDAPTSRTSLVGGVKSLPIRYELTPA
jgi:cytochrome P450